MKTTLILLPLFVLMLVAPVMAKPTDIHVPWLQAQFQWRAPAWGGPFGSWSSVYQNYHTTGEEDVFTLTGNVLHETFTYDPSVTDLRGASTVYVYSKAEGKWIQHEGTISYTSPYSQLPITEYWRGYLEFGDTPSKESFLHGVSYQWSYVYGVDEATVKAKYPNAVWDYTKNAWLVGFSIYIYDSLTGLPQAYATPFPSPFIEPTPASNYNPLGL
jgi:hypothetical protein